MSGIYLKPLIILYDRLSYFSLCMLLPEFSLPDKPEIMTYFVFRTLKGLKLIPGEWEPHH
jgi:hypothetical protein